MGVVEKLDVEADATVCGQMWTSEDLRGSCAVFSLRSHCQQVIVLRLCYAFGFDREISFSRLHSLVMLDFDAFAALGAERADYSACSPWSRCLLKALSLVIFRCMLTCYTSGLVCLVQLGVGFAYLDSSLHRERFLNALIFQHG